MTSLVMAIAILMIGFSLGSVFVLAVTHFSRDRYRDFPLSRSMGLLLLCGLFGLQLSHFFWLYLDQNWISTMGYEILLFLIAPSFFLFSRQILVMKEDQRLELTILGHGVPILIAPLLPTAWAMPIAFLVGSAYLIWLAYSIYTLRAEKESFRVEMALLGGIFVIAIAVTILGFFQTSLPGKLFFCIYSIAIGMAFLLVQIALALRPNLSKEVIETVQASYVHSTLSNVDCDSALSKLEALMETDKIYADAELGLADVAKLLGLSAHQTSELVNSRVGKSFSRYLREQRIRAAKVLLMNEPSASVLSIGLNVGFSSQSNFYEAFREVEGMPPGQYRKLNSRRLPGEN